MRFATWSRSSVLRLLSLLLALSLTACVAPKRGTVKAQQRAGNYTVNWGKSSPGGRGVVELVNIKLPRPDDITVYLGAPLEQGSWYAGHYQISVGSGGTSFDYLVGRNIYNVSTGIDTSCRGVALHFVADELYVRADTSFNGLALPPPFDIRKLRFSAQAGLGTPMRFERLQPDELQANGDSDVAFQLTPWSTHARVLVAWDPVTMNAPTNFMVRQENQGGPFGTSVTMAPMPLSAWAAAGGPLEAFSTHVIVTTTGGGGPPPAGPPAGAVYQLYLAETVVY